MQMLSHTLLKVVLQRNEVYYISTRFPLHGHNVELSCKLSPATFLFEISLLCPSGFFIFCSLQCHEAFASMSRRENPKP
jgi:hypothetical protein